MKIADGVLSEELVLEVLTNTVEGLVRQDLARSIFRTTIQREDNRIKVDVFVEEITGPQALKPYSYIITVDKASV